MLPITTQINHQSMRNKDSILKEIAQLTHERQQQESAEVLEATNKAKEILASLDKSTITFPLDAFPLKIQDIINEFYEETKLPVDYFGLGVMMAVSTVTGNNLIAQYKYGWSTPPMLYGFMVGNSGIGKSKVVNRCLAPIETLIRQYIDEHEIQMETYHQEVQKLKLSKPNADPPPPPIARRLMTSKATVESLYDILKTNPKGIILMRQEALGWIKSMNQYRSKGDDQEFFLEVWDNENITIDRVGKNLRIKKAFINVFGGVQPQIVKEFASGHREHNGFIPRLLWAFPTNLNKPMPSKHVPDKRFYDLYENIILWIHNLPMDLKANESNTNWVVDPITIELSEGAKELYFQFLCSNTEDQNSAEEDSVKAMLSKMDNYLLRFSLILEMLHVACQYAGTLEDFQLAGHQISADSMKNALKLVAYFKTTSLKVMDQFQSPVAAMPSKKQAWYKSLPNSFKTRTAIKIGGELGLSESIMYRYFNDRELFTKKRAGYIEKNFM